MINAFKLVNKYDLGSQGILWEMEHVKTAAKLAWLDNGEENKVFSISFKTTPEDGTGVFHVLEHSMFLVSFSALEKNERKAFELVAEIMKRTIFTEDYCKEMIFQILMQGREDLFQAITSEGSRYAGLRSASHLQSASALAEKTEGYDFYQYIVKIGDNFASVIDEYAEKMRKLCQKIFVSSKMTVSVTAAELENRGEILSELFVDTDLEKYREEASNDLMEFVPDGKCDFEVLANILDYDSGKY